MNRNISIEEFIDAPDTIDFVARDSDFLRNFVRDNPNILLTQVLRERYVVGYVRESNFNELIEIMGKTFLSSASIILGPMVHNPDLEASGIVSVHEQPVLNLRGEGVLIGIVDTGIDYTLDVFKHKDGTSKIRYIFDQTVRGNTPQGFYIGTEYTNEQINQALNSEDPYQIVPQRDTSGHGTFLASVAAGSESGDSVGAAPEAELIVVKLKKARQFYREAFFIPPEQENAFESSAVMVGIEYILLKAEELKRPVVICLGLGSNFGSHDGFSIFEEYLTGLSSLYGVCICTAAGNESEARHHVSGKIMAEGEREFIDLKVGENAGNIYMNIWSKVSDRVSVSVRSPTGEVVGPVPPISGSYNVTRLIFEESIISVQYLFPVEGSGDQLTIVRITNATMGVWTITLYGDVINDGTYDSWLPITGFVSPGVEFLQATPYGTIVVPGTAEGPITCGAYDSRFNSIYSRSSWGPTRARRMSPDLVAPGVNVGGFYPTGYGTMSGTSVATAITAGASALLMQWGIVKGNQVDMSTFQIKAYLINGCNRKASIEYPNFKWGYGSINLIQTFNRMREI